MIHTSSKKSKTSRKVMTFLFGICLTAILAGCAHPPGMDEKFSGASAARGVEKSAISSDHLYVYVDPDNPDRYPNVFRLGRERLIAILLMAKSSTGRYAGDTIGIYDITNPQNIYGWSQHEIGVNGQNTISMMGASFRYSLSFQDTGKDIMVVLRDLDYGRKASVPLRGLYRWRAQKVHATKEMNGRSFHLGTQGGAKGAYLFFPDQAYRAAKNPQDYSSDLAPTYVVFVNRRAGGANLRISEEIPIGDSGYVMKWENSLYEVVKATP